MSISKAQALKAKKKLASSKAAAKAAVKTSYPKFLKAKANVNKRVAMTSLGSGAVLMNSCKDQGNSCKCGQPGGNDEQDHPSEVTITEGSTNTATATNKDVTVHAGKRRKIIWQIKTEGWVFDNDQPIYIAPVPGQNEDKNFAKRFAWKFENNDRTKLVVCGNAGQGKRVVCQYNLRMWKGSSTNFAALDPALECED